LVTISLLNVSDPMKKRMFERRSPCPNPVLMVVRLPRTVEFYFGITNKNVVLQGLDEYFPNSKDDGRIDSIMPCQ
jgi:hypothetical protein